MLDVTKLSLYEINHAALSDNVCASGPHEGEHFLILYVGRKGDTSDNYTKVPCFGNNPFTKEFMQSQMEGRDPDWTKALQGSFFDKDEVKLEGAYKRKDDESGTVYTGSMKVLTLKSVVWELPCDPNTGLPIVLGIHEGKPVFMPEAPKRRKNEFGVWEMVYEYQRGWSPEERRDRTLEAFYEKIGDTQPINADEAAASGFAEEEPPVVEEEAPVRPV